MLKDYQNYGSVGILLTYFVFDLDRVEFQINSDSKNIKLLHRLMEWWHFQPIRSKKLKAEKTDIEALYHTFERSTLLVYDS